MMMRLIHAGARNGLTGMDEPVVLRTGRGEPGVVAWLDGAHTISQKIQ